MMVYGIARMAKYVRNTLASFEKKKPHQPLCFSYSGKLPGKSHPRHTDRWFLSFPQAFLIALRSLVCLTGQIHQRLHLFTVFPDIPGSFNRPRGSSCKG